MKMDVMKVFCLRKTHYVLFFYRYSGSHDLSQAILNVRQFLKFLARQVV